MLIYKKRKLNFLLTGTSDIKHQAGRRERDEGGRERGRGRRRGKCVCENNYDSSCTSYTCNYRHYTIIMLVGVVKRLVGVVNMKCVGVVE